MGGSTYLRSTGVAVGRGVGRIGAIVGPVIGTALVAKHWLPQLLWAAVPAAVSTAIIVALWFVFVASPKSAAAVAAPATTLAH